MGTITKDSTEQDHHNSCAFLRILTRQWKGSLILRGLCMHKGEQGDKITLHALKHPSADAVTLNVHNSDTTASNTLYQ